MIGLGRLRLVGIGFMDSDSSGVASPGGTLSGLFVGRLAEWGWTSTVGAVDAGVPRGSRRRLLLAGSGVSCGPGALPVAGLHAPWEMELLTVGLTNGR